MVLYLKPLEQMLEREAVLMEAVQNAFAGWGFECPFDAEAIEAVRLSLRQVRELLEAGVTELGIPQREG